MERGKRFKELSNSCGEDAICKLNFKDWLSWLFKQR